jgi:hypothetical protein
MNAGAARIQTASLLERRRFREVGLLGVSLSSLAGRSLRPRLSGSSARWMAGQVQRRPWIVVRGACHPALDARRSSRLVLPDSRGRDARSRAGVPRPDRTGRDEPDRVRDRHQRRQRRLGVGRGRGAGLLDLGPRIASPRPEPRPAARDRRGRRRVGDPRRLVLEAEATDAPPSTPKTATAAADLLSRDRPNESCDQEPGGTESASGKAGPTNRNFHAASQR